jgi:hypothetical protein
MATRNPIELTFDYGDQTVIVTVSGFTRGVTALKALGEAGIEETLATVANALRARIDVEEDIRLDYQYEDGDRAAVVVSGFTTPQRAIDALAQAGGEQTFSRLYTALDAEGDHSMLELQ